MTREEIAKKLMVCHIREVMGNRTTSYRQHLEKLTYDELFDLLRQRDRLEWLVAIKEHEYQSMPKAMLVEMATNNHRDFLARMTPDDLIEFEEVEINRKGGLKNWEDPKMDLSELD